MDLEEIRNKIEELYNYPSDKTPSDSNVRKWIQKVQEYIKDGLHPYYAGHKAASEIFPSYGKGVRGTVQKQYIQNSAVTKKRTEEEMMTYLLDKVSQK